MVEVTAAEAMAHAEAAHIKVEAHEDLCAERYMNIHNSLQGVRETVGIILKVIGWGGALLATVLISLLAFFGSRAISVNDGQIGELKAQIVTLENRQIAGPQGAQGIQGIQGVDGRRGDPAK